MNNGGKFENNSSLGTGTADYFFTPMDIMNRKLFCNKDPNKLVDALYF